MAKKHRNNPPKGVLKLSARCNQAATVILSGKVTAVLKQRPVAGRKRKRPKPKTFQIAATRSASVSQPLTLTVKLPKAALAALRAGARESVIFTLTSSNANGSSRTTAKIKALKLIKTKRK